MLQLTKVGSSTNMRETAGNGILVGLNISRIFDKRGIMNVFEISNQINFDVKRIYYIRGVPNDSNRGEHGHKELEQIFLCISGKFTLEVFDGNSIETVILDQESNAYYLPKGCWRVIKDFSPDGICLVLASELYDEKDYIHTLESFKEWKNS